MEQEEEEAVGDEEVDDVEEVEVEDSSVAPSNWFSFRSVLILRCRGSRSTRGRCRSSDSKLTSAMASFRSDSANRSAI